MFSNACGIVFASIPRVMLWELFACSEARSPLVCGVLHA
jgi:hypothetical protein